MNAWDAVLDELEAVIVAVEEALAAGAPVPDLPPFEAPTDIDLPPLAGAQLARARALQQRQATVELEASSRLVSVQLDLSELRRRRQAATAYTRR